MRGLSEERRLAIHMVFRVQAFTATLIRRFPYIGSTKSISSRLKATLCLTVMSGIMHMEASQRHHQWPQDRFHRRKPKHDNDPRR